MYTEAIVTGIAATFLASLEDLRTREVPNWLSYATAIVALFIGIVYSLTSMSFTPVLQVVAGLVAGDILGRVLYYTGQWGGGDAKLLRAMGGLFGLQLQLVPLFLVFVLNLFLAGAVFGVVWSVVLAVRHWERFSESFVETVQTEPFRTLRRVVIAVSFVLLVGIYFAERPFRLFMGLMVLIWFAMLYLWAFVKSVEASSMFDQVPVKELVPGDWVAEDVEADGEVIYEEGDLGVSPEKIEEIAAVRDAVRVKRGVPFVPSFFIAFVATVAWGNWFVLL